MKVKHIKWTVLAFAAASALAACDTPVPVGAATPLPTPATASTTSPAQLTGRTTTPAPGTTTGSTSGRALASSQPVAGPTGYRTVTWSRANPQGNGGIGLGVAVPKGWMVTKRSGYSSDFVDPTGQARLRVDGTPSFTSGDARPTATSADDEVRRLRGTAGFALLGRRDLSPVGVDSLGGTEIVYAFSEAGRTRQATFRFAGKDSTAVVVGVFYPPSQRQVAQQILGYAEASVSLAG
jgi:hypothetical protein